MALRRLLVALFLITPIISCNVITILSDLTKDSDINFFENTFPWLVDNIGSDVRIIFHFKDSGKTSGPRKCILSQLKKNIHLQAKYLMCEAKSAPGTDCTKVVPISSNTLNKCIKSKVSSFFRAAERIFRKYKVESTPVIILPRRQIISDLTPENALKSICSIFRRNKPTGCINPTELPDKESKADTETTIPPPNKNTPPKEKPEGKGEKSKEKDNPEDKESDQKNSSEEKDISSQNEKPASKEVESSKKNEFSSEEDKEPAKIKSDENKDPGQKLAPEDSKPSNNESEQRGDEKNSDKKSDANDESSKENLEPDTNEENQKTS